MDAVIFDLDGTLASCEWRRHHVTGDTKDWDSWFEKMGGDSPVPEVVDAARALASERSDTSMIVVTSRPRRFRRECEWWMLLNGVPWDAILMRANGDHRPAPEVKADALATLLGEGYNVLRAYDDDPRVLAMYEAEGVPVVRCTDPDLPPVQPT